MASSLCHLVIYLAKDFMTDTTLTHVFFLAAVVKFQSQFLDPTGTNDIDELATDKRNNFIRMTKGNLMMKTPLKSDVGLGDPFREVIVR